MLRFRNKTWGLWALFFLSPNGAIGDPQVTRADSVVEHAKNLTLQELVKYVNELGDQKNYGALKAIYLARFPQCEIAARKYCEILDDNSAVAFCASLELDSLPWRAAMFGLERHPKIKVIGYVKQVATSSLPSVRWCCYEVCRVAEWDDLMQQATQDLGRNEKLRVPMLFESTIGEVAQRYVDHFDRK